MTSPYQMFKTDSNLEKDGIKLNYGPFWIYVARAGGANKKFQKMLEARLKPYRRAIQTETLDESIAATILREVFAEGVVLGWGSEQFGEGRMPDDKGKEMPFSVENVIKLFTDLPELYRDVQEQASKVSLFRASNIEEDVGN